MYRVAGSLSQSVMERRGAPAAAAAPVPAWKPSEHSAARDVIRGIPIPHVLDVERVRQLVDDIAKQNGWKNRGSYSVSLDVVTQDGVEGPANGTVGYMTTFPVDTKHRTSGKTMGGSNPNYYKVLSTKRVLDALWPPVLTLPYPLTLHAFLMDSCYVLIISLSSAPLPITTLRPR